MALLQISREIVSDGELFDLIANSFDSLEQVEQKVHHIVFRVQNEEIPKEDKVICPDMCRFDGIKPFIIDWGL